MMLSHFWSANVLMEQFFVVWFIVHARKERFEIIHHHKQIADHEWPRLKANTSGVVDPSPKYLPVTRRKRYSSLYAAVDDAPPTTIE